MAGSFKIDDEDEYEERPRKRKKSLRRREPEEDYIEPRRRYRDPSKGSDSSLNVIWIVGIMGIVILGAVWFIASAQPAIPDFPNITIPECPQCPDLICEKDEYICNPIIIFDNITDYNCTGNYTKGDCISYVNNLDQNMTIKFMNFSNISDFIEYPMFWNDTGIYNSTKLNITKIIEDVGDYWIIQTEVD